MPRIHRAADKLIELSMNGTAEDRAEIASAVCGSGDVEQQINAWLYGYLASAQFALLAKGTPCGAPTPLNLCETCCDVTPTQGAAIYAMSAPVRAQLEPLMERGNYGPRVEFLLLYHAFQTKVDEDDHLGAAQILTNMFARGIVPLHYRHRYGALPLSERFGFSIHFRAATM